MLHRTFSTCSERPFEVCCRVVRRTQRRPVLRSQRVDLIYLQRFRSADDRRAVTERYREIFGHALGFPSHYPYRVTNRFLRCGTTLLPRRRPSECPSDGVHVPSSHSLPWKFPFSYRHAASVLCRSLSLRYPLLLVGRRESQNETLRSIAQATGHTVASAVMSSSSDVNELLGCYEINDEWDDQI